MAGRALTFEIAAAAAAALVSISSVSVLVARSDAQMTPPRPVPLAAAAPVLAEPAPAPVKAASIGAVITKRAVVVRTKADLRSAPTSKLRAGIILPVLSRTGDFVRVMTPCERTGFIPIAGAVGFQPAGSRATRLDGSTIVIDPGHGGPEPGATGPRGLKESVVNLDIARRLALDLRGARVFITRYGDYMAGLVFRTQLANSLKADAFVSVHNNAQPDGPAKRPGTETYYQHASAASKRLAGLTYEELLPSLSRFGVAWVSDKDAGAKYRTNAKGLDYYAVLRRTQVPAVITESLFISNPAEEKLLRTPQARQAIATALAKGLERFVETRDPGSGFVKPLVHNEGSVFILPPTCVDPA